MAPRRVSIAIVAALIFMGPATGHAQEPARTLSVSANADVGKVPDRAWMRFNVVAQEKEPPAALAANAEAIQKLLGQLRAKGIEAQDIQTTSLSIRAKYEMKREGSQVVRGPLEGYIAAKSVTIVIRDLATIPAFVREFPIAGQLRIADIGFFSSQAQEATTEALVKAVQEAERAAQTVAAAAKRQLGDVASMIMTVQPPVQGPPRPPQYSPYYADPRQDSAEDVFGTRLLLEPGEQSFNQSVTIQWLLR
jgi:uncharacterized protein YggE